MGYFVACVAGNAVIAAALTPLFILPYFLFGGLYQVKRQAIRIIFVSKTFGANSRALLFFSSLNLSHYQNEESTPYYFYPVKYMSWFRYGFGSLIINEFEDLELSKSGDIFIKRL